MLANYARITRWSAGLTAIIAAVMIGISAAISGSHGLIGALLGVALVAIFFGIDILVIGRVARISPQAMMVAGIILYLFKIIVLAVAVRALGGTSFFSAKLFGLTAIICILAWCAAQVITSVKFKALYVEPDGKR
jgi:ATP synthase protein I